MSHAQSIELLRGPGVKFIPELKEPEVEMPLTSPVTSEVLLRIVVAAKLFNDYKIAGISAKDVHPQSFRCWLLTEGRARVRRQCDPIGLS